MKHPQVVFNGGDGKESLVGFDTGPSKDEAGKHEILHHTGDGGAWNVTKASLREPKDYGPEGGGDTFYYA